MMLIVIYLILIGILLIVFFYLDRILKRGYYTPFAVSPSAGWALSKFAFIPLIFPKEYFKKKNFWRGYMIYLIQNLAIISIIIIIIVWRSTRG
jgi:hypothetical protein